jgi:hypothetical protein
VAGDAKRYDVVLQLADGGRKRIATIRVKDPEAAQARWQAKVTASWPREWGPDWRPVPTVEVGEAPERWDTAQVGRGRAAEPAALESPTWDLRPEPGDVGLPGPLAP